MWPYITDTARLYESLFQPQYGIKENKLSDGKLQRIATAQTSQGELKWEEELGEWVVNKWVTLKRNYETGPIKNTIQTIQLIAQPNNKCKVIYIISALPASVYGNLLIRSGWSKDNAKKIGKIFRDIDHQLTKYKTVIK